jgi:hypothetical protein
LEDPPSWETPSVSRLALELHPPSWIVDDLSASTSSSAAAAAPPTPHRGTYSERLLDEAELLVAEGKQQQVSIELSAPSDPTATEMLPKVEREGPAAAAAREAASGAWVKVRYTHIHI